MNSLNKTLSGHQTRATCTGQKKVKLNHSVLTGSAVANNCNVEGVCVKKLALSTMASWLALLLMFAADSAVVNTANANTANATMANTTIAKQDKEKQDKENQTNLNKSLNKALKNSHVGKHFIAQAPIQPTTQASLLNASTLMVTPSVAITLTKHKLEHSINQTLQKAYQAYMVGDDVVAEQYYKKVLQNESRNIDAWLGLAVIAQRQNRIDESIRCYNKVLALEPNNAIAMSNLLNRHFLEPQALGVDGDASEATKNSASDGGLENSVAIESRLKILIALQPQNANLQAALGDVYADKNQWDLAQQAYFEAYRLVPNNADYSFNLAASLDQMGQEKLALTYYKQALNLLKRLNFKAKQNSQLDENVLSARIKMLEITPMN